MPEARHGFVFMASLFVLAGMATLVTVGLSRSMTEVLATNRFVASHQAFHLAEAGLDAELRRLQQQGTFTSQEITNLVNATFPPVNLPSGSYTVDYEDGTANDDKVILVVTGTVPTGTGTTNQTLRPLVQLPLAQANAFNYAVASGFLNMDGNAIIGSDTDRATIYVDAVTTEARTGDLTTGQGNTVYASQKRKNKNGDRYYFL